MVAARRVGASGWVLVMGGLIGTLGACRTGTLVSASNERGPELEIVPAAATPGPAPASSAQPSAQRSGLIACGDVECRVGVESCVLATGAAARCVAQTFERPEITGGEEGVIVFCDDARDCGADEQCCLGSFWGGTGPLGTGCVKERCPDRIVCGPTGSCPAGLSCGARSGEQPRTCEPAAPGVACGATRCTGAAPACCWNDAASAGRCVGGSNECGTDDVVLACRNRTDCGGYLCCAGMLGNSFCLSTCPGAAVGVRCDTLSDCPSEGPGPGGMLQRYTRCETQYCTGDDCWGPDGWARCDQL